jgi:hypothetical protein
VSPLSQSHDPPDAAPESTGRPAKTTLHCQVCGHASPADGDWLRRAGPTVGRDARPVSSGVVGRGVALVCPTCDAVVTVRRR